MKPKEISKSVLKRLPSYLTYLKSLPPDSPPNISATALAAALSMGEVQVRKDLALVSDGGRPKVGYMRQSLIADIEQFLGYDNTTEAVLIGAGKLGQALLGYSGFAEYGLEIVAGVRFAHRQRHQGRLDLRPGPSGRAAPHSGAVREYGHLPGGPVGPSVRTDQRKIIRHSGKRAASGSAWQRVLL